VNVNSTALSEASLSSARRFDHFIDDTPGLLQFPFVTAIRRFCGYLAFPAAGPHVTCSGPHVTCSVWGRSVGNAGSRRE